MMQIKIFDVPSKGGDDSLELMNKFVRGHKVLDVDRQFYVSSDNVGHWSVFVTYLSQSAPQENSGTQTRPKVDYKEVLSPEEFERFTRLRSIRKMLADADAVPAYAVFTDAELAQIARLPQIDCGFLKSLSGLGEKRVEKYGVQLCEKYNQQI